MQIFVLGMHRSGTSPLTRIINMMGAYVGMEGTLMEPHKDNPKGFWERNDVYALHQEVLKAMGASWHEVAHFDLGKLTENDRAVFEQKARTIIQNLDAHRPWVLKDPRLCLLLPLWQPLLEIPVCVHICRSPLQVAQSLRTRNGFPIHFGAALWEKYNLTALTQSRDLPRLFVSHHRLLGQPLETVRALYEQLLTLGVQGLRLPSEREILAFLDPSLYRERGDASLEKEFVNLSQEELFQAFEEGTSSAFDGARTLSAGAQAALESYEMGEERERQRRLTDDTLRTKEAELTTIYQKVTVIEQQRTGEVQALQQQSSRLRILGLLPLLESGEFPASSYIRVILPLQHPSLQEYLQFAAVTGAEALAADGDILVVQRTAIPDVQAAHRLLAHCRRRNIRLVYELDDNLFVIPGHHVEAKAYHRAMQPAMTILPHVDLLVVVSEKLKEKARDFNRNVRVLPNALDERLWIAGTSRMPSGNGEARILYMGSRTHADDLLVIKEAMIRLTQEYATRVTLDVVGGVGVGEGQPWFHTFSHPPQARVNYPGFVEWFRTAPPWQIGVIPLADTEFNRSKSYIKYLDYSALGLATLCSNIEPYQGVVRNGINGFLVENSPEAWYHALKRLIEEPSLRTTLGQAAHEDFVQNHTLRTQARKWLDTYRQALNSR